MKSNRIKKLIALMLALLLAFGVAVSTSAKTLSSLQDLLGLFGLEEETPQDGNRSSGYGNGREDNLLGGYGYGEDGAYGEGPEEEPLVTEDGWYDTKDEVALYIHLYGHLPGNYITKKEAEKLGWDNHYVKLDEVAPGKSIGGSRFGNYEGKLPSAKGRTWTECDIDASHGRRGVKRIVFSNDGLIYYTDDHYETFEQLY